MCGAATALCASAAICCAYTTAATIESSIGTPGSGRIGSIGDAGRAGDAPRTLPAEAQCRGQLFDAFDSDGNGRITGADALADRIGSDLRLDVGAALVEIDPFAFPNAASVTLIDVSRLVASDFAL